MVLQECTICKNKQSVKNKKCKCGCNLDTKKKQGKIRFWIQFRLPDGKQRKEFVSYSIEDAKAADGKRKVQKKEGRIFDMLPEAKMSFQELTIWYLDQPKVQKLKYFQIIKINLSSFNKEFGQCVINQIKPVDLENYQIRRQDQGKSDSYIDQEIGAARTMLNKAWNNDKISGDALKPFKKVDKLLKKNANARDRVLSFKEFNQIMEALPFHAKGVVGIGFYTGMRAAEIMGLKWDRVDLKRKIIELEEEHTKDNEKRYIPISDSLFQFLVNIPRDIRDDHVFLYKGHSLKSIRASLKKACQEVGIPYGRNIKGGVTFHDLRHSFNTNMRRSGTHDTVTMDITGHSTREMFDRYNTIDETEKAAAVQKMEKYLDQGEDQSGKQMLP